MIEANWRKQNRTKTREINNGVHEIFMRTISCRHSTGDTRYSHCSIQKDEEENIKMLYCWWLMMDQSSSAKKKQQQRNHFPQCPTETGTKWLLQIGNSRMHWEVWHHHESHSICCLLWKCPVSILITDKALTAEKMQGSQLRKKVAAYRLEITVGIFYKVSCPKVLDCLPQF